MKREDIHLISRYSNWSERGITKTLTENVYPDAQSWKKFLHLLFISLGVGFTISGIVFFFAYNWADLHKFTKIGMVEAVVIVTTLFVLFSKFRQELKNIILTGSSVLVGVLFAVFGQIYQTGANAYDFFLVWTVFISLWVIVSNFAPLWLICLTLVNIDLLLYSQQVANHWTPYLIFTLLFLLNSSFLVLFLYLSKTTAALKAPGWFTKTIALASVIFATIGIAIGIHEEFENSFLVLQLTSIGLYAAGLQYGKIVKSKFYLSIIPFSVIIMISSLLIKISDGEVIWLIVSVFVMASVTLVIKFLIDIQKKWDHELRSQPV